MFSKQIASNFKKSLLPFRKIICAQESSLNGHKFHSWKTNFNRQSITIYFDNNKAITHMHIYFYFSNRFSSMFKKTENASTYITYEITPTTASLTFFLYRNMSEPLITSCKYLQNDLLNKKEKALRLVLYMGSHFIIYKRKRLLRNCYMSILWTVCLYLMQTHKRDKSFKVIYK